MELIKSIQLIPSMDWNDRLGRPIEVVDPWMKLIHGSIYMDQSMDCVIGPSLGFID